MVANKDSTVTMLLRDLASLMSAFEKISAEWRTTRPLSSIHEMYRRVGTSSEFLCMQGKYSLCIEDVYQIITSLSSSAFLPEKLREIADIIDSRDERKSVLSANEKAANALSNWTHDKASTFLDAYENADGNDGKVWYYKGLHDGYHSSACMFDVLTTRTKRLPPEIKPYLEKEGVL